MKIIFLGPKYTFSHEAAMKMFPKAQYFYDPVPRNIFRKVESGDMDYGILPVENSATGIIPEFFPHLLDQPFKSFVAEVKVHIMKEYYLPVYHHLLSRSDIPLAQVKTLYTHRQPYLQCADWVAENLKGVEIEFTDSTAAAAEKLSQDSKGVCIGGTLLAREQKLIKLREDIQDFSRNITRFLAVSSKHTKPPKESDKTTFAIIIPDRVGTLVRALQMISSRNLNLVNIKSLPVRAAHVFMPDFKDWFIVDVAAHSEGDEFKSLLAEFKNHSDTVLTYKVLGTYLSGWGQLKKKEKQATREKIPADRFKFFEEMIAKGESESVEFKSSLRYDHVTHAVNKELAKVVAKTICGFMNSTGGYLFIGISDDGKSAGIEYDISILTKKSVDGFLSAFYQTVADMIGKEFCQYVHPEVLDIKDKKICCIRVDMSGKAAWLADGNSFTLFIRVGNSTRPLNPKEANDYVLSRFNAK